MEREAVPLLPTMACSPGCGPSALAALQARDIKGFLAALEEEGVEVEGRQVVEGVEQTLVQVALEAARGKDEFVEALLGARARVDLQDPVLETIPFHGVVRRGDSALLTTLLPAIRDPNVQDGEGSSALHVVTEALVEAEEEQRRRLLDCLTLLLQLPGIEVNAEDMKGEATPLYYAAEAGCEGAVDLLLAFGGDAQSSGTGERVAEVVARNLPQFDLHRLNKVGRGRPLKNILFNMVEVADNVEALGRYTAGREEVDWNSDNGQFTLLQLAAELGRHRMVALLLDKGADPSRCGSNSRPAWVLAAYHGYHRVLRVFFDHLSEAAVRQQVLLTDTQHGQRTVLHEVVRRPSPRLGQDPNMDYTASLQLLFEDRRRSGGRLRLCRHMERIVNFRDRHGETALHYATQQPCQKMIQLLLRHGANMGVRNTSGLAPGTRILPATLHQFFDGCVTSEGIVTDDHFRLTFDYNFLAPPLLDAEVLEEFEERKGAGEEEGAAVEARPETEALWCMSESRQHRALLKHPLIASFLWMKWQRIRSLYYLSLAFYSVFVLVLTALVLVEYGGCSLNLTTSTTSSPGTGAAEGACGVARPDSTALRLVAGLCLLVLALVELVQLGVSVKRYLASPQNLMQVAILALATTLVCRGDPATGWEERRHLAALLTLLSWTELLLVIGQHPSLSTKLTMFYTVFITFFQFLLWYGLFVVAFALSFYLMFHKDFKGAEVNPDYAFFDNIGTSLLKSAAMFVGELEFSDIPFTSNAISSVLFVAFIFLIVVVLMNLLNGLAVSDIGLIREEAEVLALKAQVDLISYVESILLQDPYQFLTSWPRLLQALPACSACSWVRRIPGCSSLLTKVSGGARILLFYECLPDKTASFCPNQVEVSGLGHHHKIPIYPTRLLWRSMSLGV